MNSIKTMNDYNSSIARYEEVKYAIKGTDEHKEKMLLVHLIAHHERSTFALPEISPVELAEIRLKDFSFQSSK